MAVFTENAAIMAVILNGARAVELSVHVMRALVQLRRYVPAGIHAVQH